MVIFREWLLGSDSLNPYFITSILHQFGFRNQVPLTPATHVVYMIVKQSAGNSELDRTVYTKDSRLGEFDIGFNISRSENAVNYQLIVQRVSDGEEWGGEINRDLDYADGQPAIEFSSISGGPEGAGAIGLPENVIDEVESIQQELDAESEERRQDWLDEQDDLEFEAIERTEETGTHRTKYVTDRYLVWSPVRSIRSEDENGTIEELQDEFGEDGFSLIAVQDESVEEGDTTTLSELVKEVEQ
mgnify:FL=1